MMKQILLSACLILIPAGAGAMDDPCRHGSYSYAEVDPAPRRGGTLEVWPDVTCIEVPRRAGRDLGPISVYVDPNGAAAPEQPGQGREPARRR